MKYKFVIKHQAKKELYFQCVSLATIASTFLHVEIQCLRVSLLKFQDWFYKYKKADLSNIIITVDLKII